MPFLLYAISSSFSVCTLISGQKFKFCTMQDGYDTCKNCPLGLTHRDTIYTSKFDSEIDPCIEEEMCDGCRYQIVYCSFTIRCVLEFKFLNSCKKVMIQFLVRPNKMN